MATDDEWTPERSRGMERRDIRDEPGRMLQLADEDGVETWLDLNTGNQIQALAHRDPAPPAPASPGAARRGLFDERPPKRGAAPANPLKDLDSLPEDEDDGPAPKVRAARLRARIVEMLQAERLRFRARGRYAFEVAFKSRNARYSVLIGSDDEGYQVRVFTHSDLCVPEERRAAVCEFLMLVNWQLFVGSFELDPRDGEVRFKGTTFLANDGVPGQEQLSGVLHGGVYVFDAHYPALARVIDGASPEDGLDDVQDV